jgi:uncharacterized membrane protein YcgQ (UPF0703/DUF1980 family)
MVYQHAHETLQNYLNQSYVPYGKMVIYLLMIFIDDILIISTSHEGCITSIIEAINLLTNIGFVLHVEKSIFFPQQKSVFLGFELNSATMKI